ncbi:hypothetical protein LCGC14_0475460 [marine sediment metagenome]|uniref:Uncharacterized protein n=1 Tax=marine sediment metagenome TaxID=412755 RepID=A0A0F9VJP8_9ZZZZ
MKANIQYALFVVGVLVLESLAIIGFFYFVVGN